MRQTMRELVCCRRAVVCRASRVVVWPSGHVWDGLPTYVSMYVSIGPGTYVPNHRPSYTTTPLRHGAMVPKIRYLDPPKCLTRPSDSGLR